MADYFTQFSCLLDVGTIENAERAMSLRDELADEIDGADGVELGFDMEQDPTHGPGGLWISSDGFGDPEHVIRFVLICAEAFDLTGRWGFMWSLTCSKPRLDGFGGGAQVLDLDARSSIAWIDCDQWLRMTLDPAVTSVQGTET